MVLDLLGRRYATRIVLVALCWLPLTAFGTHRSNTVTLLRRQRRVVRVPLGPDKGRHGVALAAFHKTAFFGKVLLGTPPQEFAVVFDTGSGNVMVPATDCPSTACEDHERFRQVSSSTASDRSCDGSPIVSSADGTKAPLDQVAITFGTGEVWGRCVRDRICLGSMCADGSFVAATYESEEPFDEFEFDGVLGLALPHMSQGADFNLMEQFVQSDVIQQPLFAVYLSNRDDADASGSEITFGEMNEERMASDLVWASVARDSGYWEVKIDDITLDGKPQQLCVGCYAAVDTGTSELAGPSDVVEALAAKLRTGCDNISSLPRLGFVVAGHALELTPADYVEKLGNQCDLTLMPLDVPPPKGPLFVLGVPFLQKFYTVYDSAARRIGFAAARHDKGTPAGRLVTSPQRSNSPPRTGQAPRGFLQQARPVVVL